MFSKTSVLIPTDMTDEELLGCYLVVVKFEIMITSFDITLSFNKKTSKLLRVWSIQTLS